MKRKELAEIVVKLCNKVLLKREQPQLPEMTAKNWNQVLSFASMQGVLPVITQLFADYEPEDAQLRGVLVEWYVSALENHQAYKLRTYNMREMALLFEKEGMDIMFMKGATLAQLYPKPEWRVFNDIDYYLYGKSEQGVEVMARHGIENSAYYHHHTQASLNKVLLENHYDFVERENHECDVILDDALKELAAKEGHTIKADFLGKDVNNAYLMTPTMNAIFLMRHMSAHFVGETIPLRQLYDWALFLKKYAGEVDWSYVLPLYEQSGMMRFAEIIMTILKNHLEFESSVCPVILGEREQAEKVWESIINPSEPDPYDKFTLRYYMFEAKTFFVNRWKHKLVYPGESFVGLFFKYARLAVKKMLGFLK
jgi:hypothetical protein